MLSEAAALIHFPPSDPRSAALEAIERDAWLDAYRAADGQTAEALQMTSAVQDGIGLTAMRAIDFELFNRAQGLGCDTSQSEIDVMKATLWLRMRCAPKWRIQLVPSSLADDFRDRVARLGLIHKGRGPAKLFRDTAPRLASQAERQTDLNIRAVTIEIAQASLEVVRSVYKMPPPITDWGASLIGRVGWHAYAAFDGSLAVAFGLMFVRGEQAWLGWGATLPSHRGRGAQSAILRCRTVDGEALGVKRFVTECEGSSEGNTAASSSYRNIVRAGFTRAYVRTAYGLA